MYNYFLKARVSLITLSSLVINLFTQVTIVLELALVLSQSLHLEGIDRLHVVLDRVVIGTHVGHVTSIVLNVDVLLADIHGDEPASSGRGVGGQEFGVRAKFHSIVAVASGGQASCTTEHVVGVVVVVVCKAVVVAVENNALVLLDNLNQRGKVGLVGGGGHVGVVQLEELPVGGGVGKRLLQEVDLNLGVVVAFVKVGGVVDRGGFLVRRKEAVGVNDDEGGLPVCPSSRKCSKGAPQYPKYHLSSINGATLVWKSTPAWPDNVVVTDALVPTGIVEDALAYMLGQASSKRVTPPVVKSMPLS